MTELMLRAILAGCGVGALAGMLGCFVLWRRMSYAGDAMGHAALCGVALGLLLGIAPPLAVLVVALLVGILLGRLGRDRRLPFDALLAVISTGGLSLGMVLLTLVPGRPMDINGYLFGDVLAVSNPQLAALFALLALQSLLLFRLRGALLRMIAHEDIARVEGVPVERLQMLMTALIALMVALAMQIVGILLVTALLVIPPLTARLLARDPVQMIVFSTLTGIAAALLGVLLSYQLNLATGPGIVLAALGLLLAARCAR